MYLNEYPKVTKSLENMISCLQCEVCKTVTNKPLLGLCSNHIFCKTCAIKTNQCPSCNTALRVENINVNLSLASEILPLLNSIKECLNQQQVGDKNDETRPAIVKETKAVNKIKSTAPVAKVSSPVSSLSSKNSPAMSRRSSVGLSQDINKRNKKGETLLHVACIKGNEAEVKRLVEAGARCATKDYAGWTPLHEVAQQNNVSIARLLLEHGAKVNAPGLELNSPLHDAVSNGREEMVRLLMQFGASPDQHNLYGVTPRDMAKNGCLAELLQKNTSEISVATSGNDDSELLISPDQKQLSIMASGLDKKQSAALASLTKVLAVHINSSPSRDIRLVITDVKSNKCERSVAVLTGLCLGAWIVSPEWLEMSANSKILVDPEPFEIYGTVNQHIGDAPKRSRQNSKNLMPGLFAGCHIYFATANNLDGGLDRKVLTELIRFADGQVLTRSPDPEDIPSIESTVPFHAPERSSLAKCSHYVIYQSGAREPQMKYNMKHIKSLPHTWLLDCIENFSLIDPQ